MKKIKKQKYPIQIFKIGKASKLTQGMGQIGGEGIKGPNRPSRCIGQ